MSFDVPEEVLRKTLKCSNGFSCLRTGNGKCKVCDVDGEDMLFVSCNNFFNCRYRIFYGDRQLCACPTHYALYTKRIK